MDSYAKFDAELRACSKCASILSTIPVDPCVSDARVEPRPIVSGIRLKPVLLIGQAPGLTEYETRKPFQGPAGREIREIFAEAGVLDFDGLVYSSAVVKCYPGRKKRSSKRGCEDRVPSAAMVNNCRPFLERQVGLVDPKIIVTLGSFPLKAYLRISGQGTTEPRLERYVGTSQAWGKRTVVFFPHTSGTARWLNGVSNRLLFGQAKNVLRDTLLANGVV